MARSPGRNVKRETSAGPTPLPSGRAPAGTLGEGPEDGDWWIRGAGDTSARMGEESLPARFGSEQAALGKRNTALGGNDHVVQHADVDQGQRLLEALGDSQVRLAGLADP